MTSQIVYDDFARVQMIVGRITQIEPFERARQPSYKVDVDLGDLGARRSSAQITHYRPDELVGRLVVCVANLPPRNIAGFQSEVLILGARDTDGKVILLSPEAGVPVGSTVF